MTDLELLKETFDKIGQRYEETTHILNNNKKYIFLYTGSPSYFDLPFYSKDRNKTTIRFDFYKNKLINNIITRKLS